MPRQHPRLSARHVALRRGGGGGLQHGERLEYRVLGGTVLLGGSVHIDGGGGLSGILCDCCGAVVSASLFEAHAGALPRPPPPHHSLRRDHLRLLRYTPEHARADVHSARPADGQPPPGTILFRILHVHAQPSSIK